jgi:glutamine amidotransferase PdxT
MKKILGILVTILVGSSLNLGSGVSNRRVYIYTGSGAVFAGDVELALDKMGISYYEVDEDFIAKGNLYRDMNSSIGRNMNMNCTCLIVPGGDTSVYAATLSKNFNKIGEFVLAGGKYIGICAGAYIASDRVELPGHPEGLGIINITNKRRSGIGLVDIIMDLDNPVAEGCPKLMKIWYQNGPYIIPGEGVKVVARYDEDYAAVVHSKYGKGNVIIFSPHPEGSIENGIDPAKLGTIKLLENSIKLVE